MPDAAYYRAWRARNAAYRAREVARSRARREAGGRGDRTKEYSNRNAARRTGPTEPLPQLYAHLRRGAALSFWNDELAMDLAQERELARLEGRDPEEAARHYGARERAWRALTMPLADET